MIRSEPHRTVMFKVSIVFAFRAVAFATAPIPFPEIDTVGFCVYPVPGLVIVTPVTTPLDRTAVPVAVIPVVTVAPT
jgi:hypothetical protein